MKSISLDPAQHAGYTEFCGMIAAAHRALVTAHPACAETWRLHDMEGWDYDELSEKLHITKVTVRRRVHVGRVFHREYLGGWEHVYKQYIAA